jgi:hypothetical protein
MDTRAEAKSQLVELPINWLRRTWHIPPFRTCIFLSPPPYPQVPSMPEQSMTRKNERLNKRSLPAPEGPTEGDNSGKVSNNKRTKSNMQTKQELIDKVKALEGKSQRHLITKH